MSNAEFKAYLREQAKNLISNGTIKETTTYSEIEEIFRENVSNNANEIFVEMFFEVCEKCFKGV